MTETDIELKAEITLYYDLRVPDDAKRPMPLLIAVHGYGAHKRYMMREAQAAAPAGFAIASIQGPHQHFRRTDDGIRTGFGWLTDHKPEEYIALHHGFVNRVIDKLADSGVADAKRVFLYGFSQACALNFRYAFTFPERLAGIIGVCGGIPGDLETNAKYSSFRARTLYLFGDEDEFYTQERYREFEEKLAARLPNFSSKRFKANHEITEEMREEIRAFLRDVA